MPLFPLSATSCLSVSSGGPGFPLFPKYTYLSPFAISRGLLEGVGTAVRWCLLSVLEPVLQIERHLHRCLVDYLARLSVSPLTAGSYNTALRHGECSSFSSFFKSVPDFFFFFFCCSAILLLAWGRKYSCSMFAIYCIAL